MLLRFLGAAGMVTGSSYLLDSRILVDFGIFQGGRDSAELNSADLSQMVVGLKAVIVTHAHLDHCGRLPLLSRWGYQGPIYTTLPSTELVDLVLRDSAKIAKEDRNGMVLYTEGDVEKVTSLIKGIDYHQSADLGDGDSFCFWDAGHILGSASVEMNCGGKKIIFSGDLGNTPQPLVRPTEYPTEGQVVLMESTYGDRLHPKEDPSQVLLEEIGEIEKSGGALLIPSFSLERTQELLHHLDHLKKTKKIRDGTRVFLDSPMAIKATDIFREYRYLYNVELKNHSAIDDPFDFPGLTVVRNPKESKRIFAIKEPKVILAGSGMMTGGRIMGHAIKLLPFENTRLLFVGYQAMGTLGRSILDGTKQDVGTPLMVRIGDVRVEVRANVRETASMSAHADQGQLIDWLGHINGVNKIFLVHGDEEPRKTLRDKIDKNFTGVSIETPVLNDEFEI